MKWDFPQPPAWSREGVARELLVHVGEVGQVLELPVPASWTVDDVITTLAEIQTL